MVKDQHPQAAKDAAANVLPSWLDAFKVLLDLDPEQDVSGGPWDGLEIRIQIFKVRTALFLPPNLILTWQRDTDSPDGPHIISSRGSPVFASLCRSGSASPPRTLPDLRTVLPDGQCASSKLVRGRTDRVVQADHGTRRFCIRCYPPEQVSRVLRRGNIGRVGQCVGAMESNDEGECKLARAPFRILDYMHV